ncbi:hypothetical protein ACU686_03660 [Yinghuangia aomiensis]
MQPLFTAPEDLVGTWTAWGFACTQNSAVGAAVVFRRRRETAAAVAVLAGTYLVATTCGGARSGHRRRKRYGLRGLRGPRPASRRALASARG